MVKNDFLDCIKGFTEEAIKELILPVRVQSENEAQSFRAAEVYKMRLPDSASSTKKAPYIIHSIITSKTSQKPGERTESTVQLRSVFCVYHDDEQEGALALVELMDRFALEVQHYRVIDKRYEIDLNTGMESLYYPSDDTAPYFLGETVSTWKIPQTEREVQTWLN